MRIDPCRSSSPCSCCRPVRPRARACTLTQVTASDGFDSQAGGLSANGRYLALTSRADLTGGNTDHGWDLFLYDRTADSFTQLTHLTDGYAQKPTLDSDGSHVFYRSNVDPDSGLVLDFPQEVLVRLDLATDERTVVARDFSDAAVSGDGSRVALVSDADFTGENADGNEEIFLLDLASETYAQVTDTPSRPVPRFPGICPANLEPAIDTTGRHVAFFSDLDPIASGDPSAFGGIYVYDSQTGTTTRVVLHATLPRIAISGDGGSVAFPTIDDLSGDNPVG